MINKHNIETIYLYIALLIGLILIIAGASQLLHFIFNHFLHLTPPCPATGPDVADCQTFSQYESIHKLQSGLINLIIGLPLYLYHQHLIRKRK